MLEAIDTGLLCRALVVARRGWTATPREGGDGPMQSPPPLSPETLAAQALGDVGPVSGGLTPVIDASTSYEQLPDGSYRQDRVYTRADNPTYETAEGLLAALEGPAAPARCLPPGWRPPPRSSSPCCRAITSWSPGSSTGGA
jgi:hypothetical protein